MKMYITALKTYFRLMNNLKRPLSELKEKQWQAFCDLVKFAYEHVPLYRELYDQAQFSPESLKEPSDITLVPLTKKEMFQQVEPEECIARGNQRAQLVSKRTSGSSGFPLIIYYTPEDRIYRTILHLRILFANGMGFRDRMVQICDKRHVPDFRYKFQKFGFLPKDFVYCADRADHLIDALTAINPTVIYSYTSSLALIANEVKERGTCPIQPKLIFTTGELMNPCDRENIEQAFSVPPHDIYGIVEMGDVAWQCSELNGYHVNIDSCLAEVLVNGRPAESGESGRLVITNLHSRAMPFIRYEVGDVMTVPHDAPCSCGCNFPRINIIQGRQDDWLHALDGRRISPLDITIARVTGVQQYRIIQKSYDYLIIEVVPGLNFNTETVQGVEQHLREIVGTGVHVEVRKVDEIPRRSGKIRSVFCEIKQPIHE